MFILCIVRGAISDTTLRVMLLAAGLGAILMLDARISRTDWKAQDPVPPQEQLGHAGPSAAGPAEFDDGGPVPAAARPVEPGTRRPPAAPRIRLETFTMIVPRAAEDSPASPRIDPRKASAEPAAETDLAAANLEPSLEESRVIPEIRPRIATTLPPVTVEPEAVPVSAAPARTPAAHASVAPASVNHRDAIWGALREYKQAYERLDVAAAMKIWPSVDRRRLSRAFGSIRSQGLTLDHCEIHVVETSATAHCEGEVRFVPKVGSSQPLRLPQEWIFEMRRSDTAWTISTVTAYQPSGRTAHRSSTTH